MKKVKTFLGISIFAILFTFLNVDSIVAAEKFEIDRLDVNIHVNEDGTYDIAEHYIINYTIPTLGMYRDIVTVVDQEFTDSDTGEQFTKRYRFPVSNIRVEGEEYALESNFDTERIILGPEYGEQYTGIREFTIFYKVQTQPLNLKVQKEAFFQNLVSSWDTPMHEFHALVSFQKDVDLSLLAVNAKDINSEFPVDCTVGKNEFNCDIYESLHLGKGNGITALLPLPDDYFTRPQATTVFNFAFIAIGLILIGGILLKVMVAHKIPFVEKVSFMAPKGYNSPMVGYVYRDRTKIDDMYTLIFEWANQGLIKINETEEGISFEKLKDIETDIAFEAKLYKILMYKDTEITVEDWTRRNVYGQLLPFLSQIPKQTKAKGTIYNKQAQSLKTIVATLTFITMALFTFSIINYSLMSILGSVILTGVIVFVESICFGIFDDAYNKSINKSSERTGIIPMLLFILITAALTIVFGFAVEKFLSIQFPTVKFMLFYILLNSGLIVASTLKVRTQYGADLFGEIMGLKNFIKYAKEDELRMMQEDNPYLYYDVLPYAQVFGMSDLWLKHFKKIEIPQSPYYTTYRANTFNNYLLMRSLTSSMRSMSTQTLPRTSSGSGGGTFSSGGGGFSGGGSFSGGGGFGGGGGGSR